jgi:hypothetical protein
MFIGVEKMDSKSMIYKTNRILRYLIIMGMITLAISTIYLKLDSCNKCSFRVTEKNKNYYLNANEFMNKYSSMCLTINSTNILDLKLITNLS